MVTNLLLKSIILTQWKLLNHFKLKFSCLYLNWIDWEFCYFREAYFNLWSIQGVIQRNQKQQLKIIH